MGKHDSDAVTSQPTLHTMSQGPYEVDFNHLNQGGWQVKMTDCFSDIPTCLMGYCCPCFVMYQSAEKLGQNGALYCCGAFCFPTMVALRVKVRERFGIQDDIMSDVINSGCCCWGALSVCQVANELKKRGL